MPLTDLKAKNAAPRPKNYKISDGEGMYLLVRTGGGRSWLMDFTYLGKRQTLTIGPYPEISLAEAREKRFEARRMLANGQNPAEDKKLNRLKARTAAESTFSGVANELLAKWKREGQAERTLNKKRWLLDLLDRMIGNRPISAIEPPELLAALRTVENRDNFETTKRLRIIAGQVFRYAIANHMASRDPTQDLRGALITPKVKNHAAITKPSEIGALLRAIDGYAGNASTVAALRLAPLVFLRPGELRQLRWEEVDLEKACITIPAEKMKMRREHRVPLSRQAVAIIQEIRPFSAASEFVFPAVGARGRSLSENTLNAAIRRLGYQKGEMTSHGFRTIASTHLHESGRFRSDAIEMQMAHVDANTVRRTYNWALYWPERVEMMQFWADWLDERRSEGA